MKAFWHSSSAIYDLATRARLSLSFEDIVVPHDEAGYFPHADLKRPSSTSQKGRLYPEYEFWPSSARAEKAFYPHSAFGSWEVAFEKFGQKFADAQYDRVKELNRMFDHYLRTAVENDGILVGDTELAESDFKTWLSADLRTQDNSKRLRIAQALLSLAGVEIALPDIAPQHMNEVLELKAKYEEEVRDYQAYIAELLGGTWDLVKSDPSLQEISKWTNFIATTKISPALRRVEAAIRTGDRQLLERIGYGLITDLPNLVAGQLRGPNVSLITAGLESLLKVLAPNLAQSIRERRALESSFGLSYLYRIGKAARTT
jgi:hypothetical protein